MCVYTLQSNFISAYSCYYIYKTHTLMKEFDNLCMYVNSFVGNFQSYFAASFACVSLEWRTLILYTQHFRLVSSHYDYLLKGK